MSGADTMPAMYADLFDQLLTFVEYSCKPPKFGKVEAKSVTTVTKAGQVYTLKIMLKVLNKRNK